MPAEDTTKQPGTGFRDVATVVSCGTGLLCLDDGKYMVMVSVIRIYPDVRWWVLKLAGTG